MKATSLPPSTASLNWCPSPSCVAYNPYHKHHLVSSDYEGCVCVWDTNVGRRTALHQVQVPADCPAVQSRVHLLPCPLRSTAGGCGLWPTTRRSPLCLPLAVMTALSSCGVWVSPTPSSPSLPKPTSALSSSTHTLATSWPMALLVCISTDHLPVRVYVVISFCRSWRALRGPAQPQPTTAGATGPRESCLLRQFHRPE